MTRPILAAFLVITATGCGSAGPAPTAEPRAAAPASDPAHASSPDPWETIDPAFEGCGGGG
jgi:hypothetical protein